MTGDRLLAVGGIVVGVGAAGGVAYWIFCLENSAPFWTLPGVASVVVSAVGALLVVVGFFKRTEDDGPSQVQRGGRGSRNYQAGRDMTVGGDEDGDR